ncbi:hypothetical protein LBE40_00160 [Bartonella taylorii]|uniref:Uncharacterized protein n=1 Tax=Bartonella taylorii 8TBB TaxID=1094560 RepID=A0A9P2W3G5_BARTA|nr:hypothetical protein [Bartonella taylorii]EJF97797.1 hypothetical protein ME9_00063 [Bartonella taylorii 8TBB]USP01301.1 hypothetical protein LBE40_00160 [Bartonella taylorii]
MKAKNSTFNKKSRSFLFETFMMFSLKNYKMTLGNFLIAFYTFLIMMVLEVPAFATPLPEVLHGESWNGVGYLIFLLPVLIWVCLFIPLPIFWGVRSIRERKLRKAIQQVKEMAEMQDKSDKV